MTKIDKASFLNWPCFEEDERTAVNQVLASGKVNYWTGEEGRCFEKEYATAVSVQHAIALANGTVALEAALAALDIGVGDEVIVPCRTFIATAACVVMRGARPILADVDLASQNITLETIQRVVTSKTKAIIVVHLAGWPCEMQEINAFAKHHNIFVIEDCAQAHGAIYRGLPVGSLGDIAAFSFCQDKIITTGGEGGMVTTNHAEFWEKIWSLKDHGKSYKAVHEYQHPVGFRWVHESFGTNWRLTEMQAAIGRIQLRKLTQWIQQRQRNAQLLTEQFKTISGLRVTEPPLHIQHAYYKYYVFLELDALKSQWDRNRVMQSINDVGIPCYSGSCSEIYLEQAFIERGWSPTKRFANAKSLGETSLMFLVHPTLTEEQILLTAQQVRQVMALAVR